MVANLHAPEEVPRRRLVVALKQHKIKGLAAPAHCAVVIHPLALNLDIYVSSMRHDFAADRFSVCA